MTEPAAPPIASVLVVVPARDEVETIRACLRSLDRAAALWAGRVVVVVGADGCSDGTAAEARRARLRAVDLVVLEGTWGRAGRTRRACTVAGLARIGGDPASVWIANTDADSTVPPGWLVRQVEAAGTGVDLVLGVVALDGSTPSPLRRRFEQHYPVPVDHPHVHAANLGIRASAYGRAGGWSEGIEVGEEHDLLRRVTAAGGRVQRDAGMVITTSGRTSSRVLGGFATVLAGLEPEAGLAAS